jgi:iron(III) transport system substrate-binding protein
MSSSLFLHRLWLAVAGVSALLLSGCSQTTSEPGTGSAPEPTFSKVAPVTLYTTREPGLVQPLLDAFTKDTGIVVDTVFVRDGLPERLRAEGERSPADVLRWIPEICWIWSRTDRPRRFPPTY